MTFQELFGYAIFNFPKSNEGIWGQQTLNIVKKKIFFPRTTLKKKQKKKDYIPCLQQE